MPVTRETPPRTPARFTLHAVDLPRLTDRDHADLLRFSNRLRAESHPDDPPRTEAEQRANWANIPPAVEIHSWVVRDEAAPESASLVGRGELQIIHQGETGRDVAWVSVSVLPERRREGVARRLLAPIAARARELARTRLMADTHSHAPAGASLMQSLGARPGLVSQVHQLALGDLDPAALRAYRERAERRGGEGIGDIELVRCDSPFPAALYAPIAALSNRVSEDVPFGDLDVEPFHMTGEAVAGFDRSRVASGAAAFLLLARDRRAADGTLVGLTELTWRGHAPAVAEQGITGVLPAYRGRGLASRLKATLLEQVRAEHPEIRFIRTTNADVNAGIRAINEALGFRPYRAVTTWQVPTEQVLAWGSRA